MLIEFSVICGVMGSWVLGWYMYGYYAQCQHDVLFHFSMALVRWCIGLYAMTILVLGFVFPLTYFLSEGKRDNGVYLSVSTVFIYHIVISHNDWSHGIIALLWDYYRCEYALWPFCKIIESLWTSQWSHMTSDIWSSLAKVMACRLLDTKLLPEPMLTHCQFGNTLQWILNRMQIFS